MSLVQFASPSGLGRSSAERVENDNVRGSSALIMAPPLLAKYVIKNIDSDPVGRDERCRRVAQAVVVANGVTGSIPYAAIAFNAESNVPYGVFLASCYAFRTSSLNMWSLGNVVDEYLHAPTEEENLLQPPPESCCVNTAVKVVVVMISLTATLPTAFVAYSLNNNSLAFGIIQLVTHPWTRIYSLKLSIDEIIMRRRLTQGEKKLFQMKQYLIAQFRMHQEHINELELQESAGYLLELYEICGSNRSEMEKATLCLRKLLGEKPEVARKERWGTKALRYVTGASGAVLGLANLALLGVVGYKSTELFTDNLAVCYAAGAISVLTNVHVMMGVSVKAPVRIYNLALRYLRGTKRPLLSLQIQPKLTASLWILTVAVCSLSYPPTLKSCQYYLSGTFGDIMQILAPMAIIMVSLNASFDLIGDIVRQYALRKNSPEVNQLLRLNYMIKRFIHLIQQSPMLEFVKFTKVLPPEILEACLEKAKLTSGQLNDYLGGSSAMVGFESLDQSEREENRLPMVELEPVDQ